MAELWGTVAHGANTARSRRCGHQVRVLIVPWLALLVVLYRVAGIVSLSETQDHGADEDEGDDEADKQHGRAAPIRG